MKRRKHKQEEGNNATSASDAMEDQGQDDFGDVLQISDHDVSSRGMCCHCSSKKLLLNFLS